MTERRLKQGWDGGKRLLGECPGGVSTDLTPTPPRMLSLEGLSWEG